MENLIGQKVELWCECYIYTGEALEVTEHSVVLKDAAVVYETGRLSESGFMDCQSFERPKWFVRIDKIESYGIIK